MFMDPSLSEIFDSVNGFQYDEEIFFPNLDQNPNHRFNFPSMVTIDPIAHDSSLSLIQTPISQESLSPISDENDSNPVLAYITQVLMEENMEDEEDKPSMFFDPSALQQTEEMLYQMIGESQTLTNSSQDSVVSRNSGDFGSITSSGTSPSSCTDLGIISDPQMGINHFGVSNDKPNFEVPISNGLVGSLVNQHKIQNMFSDAESVLQFRKGLEEASKFLPGSNQLNVLKDESKGYFKFVSEKKVNSRNPSRGRKTHKREETGLEDARSNKQTAINVEEGELSEMFDKVLIFEGKCVLALPSNPWKSCPDEDAMDKTRSNQKSKKEKNRPVDFHSLLIQCAQAISAGDNRTANELLKQIREESSPVGDSSQRLAHCFANGLEARMIGSMDRVILSSYKALALNRTTAAEILKTYKVHLSAAAFKTFMYFFGNKVIVDAAENAPILHIVDFGILYGFQWPMLIQHLSRRKGGPPKLRITGIELPQSGLRPAERIKETGRRLAKYCERFGVPFEYYPVASQNWESIRIDDLEIKRNEILVVNCNLRFTNLLDETSDEENCPRNAILNLIREMNPNVFVHSVVNGSYNSPFFATRFKEALFHFSAFFDIFDSTLARDCQDRLMIERDFYGKEVMNVIACEGSERIERPETYKQWHVRTVRAGFKQKRVDKEFIEKFRGKLKMWYHKDFMMDLDGDWFLQGWKGRIMSASSCWVPV